MSGETEIQWKQTDMVEVVLKEPDDFLKVRETLTRIGVASRKREKFISPVTFYTSRVSIILFILKSCLLLMESYTNFSLNDLQRRNRIAQLLSDWGLISIVTPEKVEDLAPLNQIKVLAFKDKDEWTLESKYNIGRKKTAEE